MTGLRIKSQIWTLALRKQDQSTGCLIGDCVIVCPLPGEEGRQVHDATLLMSFCRLSGCGEENSGWGEENKWCGEQKKG